ncbi:MAG: CidA/LrgA family protein [Veillonella sp.]|uniref:CidA/LrgA family protein n=1 Tax=Veillonella sp. TaxID=1926307 RepID=UPI0025E01EAC|nr:CidA/LrgA family protein [Veillonella sp.]MBS4913284.1 CidA/LrgA family protein [Veillonella sp.]
MKRFAIIVGQVLFLSFIGVVGNFLQQWLHLPLPGTLVGMLLLFALLMTGVVKLDYVEQGAAILISELLLFFIPSAIGVIQYTQLFGSTGAMLLGVIVTSIVTLLLSVLIITLNIMKLRRKGYRLW